jgi:hypothetical protein
VLFLVGIEPPDDRHLLVVAARDLQQIDTQVREPTSHLRRLFVGEATSLEVGGVELHAHGKVRAHDAARCRHNLAQKSRPIFERATPFVRSAIGPRGKELAQKVSVGRVHLNTMESGILCGLRDVREPANDVTNLRHFEGTRRCHQSDHALHLHGRCRDGMAARHARALTPWMTDLHPQVPPPRAPAAAKLRSSSKPPLSS